MSKEIDLPTPPDGHFWRVTPVGDEAVCVELRRTVARWFSIRADWTERVRWPFALTWDFEDAAQRCAEELLARHQKTTYRDSIRWGDYS